MASTSSRFLPRANSANHIARLQKFGRECLEV